MPVEEWKSIFDWGAVILLFFTFAFGAAVLIAGNIINKRQESQLRQFDKDLTDAKTRLGEQQERAAGAEKALEEVEMKTEGFRLAIAQANERASKAQESLALAERYSAEANAKTEKFRLDIANANERAAEANRIAEQERLARLQLEARLADRVLLPFQEQKIEEAFTPLKGATVEVSVVGDAIEVAQFSNKIMTAIRKAGVLLIVRHPIGLSAQGVVVGVKPDAPEQFKKTAEELIVILRQGGLGAGPWEFDKLLSGVSTTGSDKGAANESPLRIVIGSK